MYAVQKEQLKAWEKHSYSMDTPSLTHSCAGYYPYLSRI